MQVLILCNIFIPIAAGIIFLLLPSLDSETRDNKIALAAIASTAVTVILTGILLVMFAKNGEASVMLFEITDSMKVYFSLDKLGAFFLGFISIIWLLGGIFSMQYLHHENHRKRFWGFYLLTLGALQGLSLSGNLVTLYLFFEMMTLVSMPMVLHSETHEAIMASLKYLFYSMCGAYMALFGVFVIYHYVDNPVFTPGGVLDASVLSGNEPMLFAGILLMVMGFGAKAGMFPLHAWLPTAHPVAPAPASAVLSAIIVKGGVLAIIRSVYYTFGADLLKGTWVQYTWLALATFTVFMGSMLAYNEKVLKKRLAYSSVSQASYIMLGLAALNSTALTGSLLHVLFHALIKTALFLVAGAIIFQTGYTRVDQLKGLGKEMPVTMWCWTFVSLALVGIPPASGFISKWYLGTGLLSTGIKPFYWLGPVTLLVSALLTAGYLLTITVKAFLPGEGFDYSKVVKREPVLKMLVPIMILAASAVLFGLFPNGLISYLSGIAGSLV